MCGVAQLVEQRGMPLRLRLGGHHVFMGKTAQDYIARLTPKQHQVVSLLARGYEIKEIARSLGIHYHTAKMHILDAKGNTGARNRLELVILFHGAIPDSLKEDADYPIDRASSWRTRRGWF